MVRKLLLICLLWLTGACASESPPAERGQTRPDSTTTDSAAETGPSATDTAPIAPSIAANTCDGDVVFSHPPVDLDAVEYLMPFGLMIDSHVTPVDHQYFQNFVEPDRAIDVYSPGAGRVVSIQHFGAPVAENREGVVDDFRLIIEHTCAVSSIFIHIDTLIPRLAALDPGIGYHASVDVPVEGGELIGSFTSNVDYNLVDLNHRVDGLLDPTSYQQEPWKIHVPDTFDYFTPDIRARMEALSLRNGEPLAGLFAYDIDGKAVGNWFLEGTNGYGGVDPDRYWAGHLTFAYDHLDPTMVVVSIGTFDGRSAQFAVLGNGPDPAWVSVATGVVVYELVRWDYLANGDRWDRATHATNIRAIPGDQVDGIIAIQVIADRELLVEVTPGARAEDFAGFSQEAATYRR